MNCEKCGHEMLVVKLGQFGTDYQCPVCGHFQAIGLLRNEDLTSQEEMDTLDALRLALIQFERDVYQHGPGTDLDLLDQFVKILKLNHELAGFEKRPV